MRVNIDEKASHDPRFRMLSRAMGLRVEFVIGLVACGPWMAALNRVTKENPSGLMTREQANNSSDDGAPLIDAMLMAELAAIDPETGQIYFAGVAERGYYLLTQRKKAAKGGRSKAKKEAKARLAGAMPGAMPGLSQRLGSGQAKGLALRSGSGSGSGSASGSGSQKKLSVSLERLTTIYERYPRKVGKTDGLKILSKSVTTDDEFELCMKAVTNFADLQRGIEQPYIRHFDRWARTWRDWIDAKQQLAMSPVIPVKPYVAPVVEHALPADEISDMAKMLIERMKFTPNPDEDEDE